MAKVLLGGRRAALLAALAVVACAKGRPAPPPAPEPAPAAAPTPVSRPPLAPVLAAGTYTLQAVVQGRQIPGPPPQARARGRQAAPPAASLVLVARASAAPNGLAPSTTQLSATVALPGYTMAPRGRTQQAATWWPSGGDSLTVFWMTPRNATIALKGALRGDTLSGDVWYTSLESGAEFQLGTFNAVRRRAGRR